MKIRHLIFLLPLMILTGANIGPSYGAKTMLEQEWSRYQGWTIESFTLEGCPSSLKGSLQGGLALAGKGRILRSRLFPTFSYRLLRDDLARTRLYLAREGY